MIEVGVDLGDKGEFVDLSFVWGSEYLSTGDDFVEEWVDGDFLVGCPGGISEGDAGRSAARVGVNGAGCDVDSASVLLCVFEDSVDGFFSSRENGVI